MGQDLPLPARRGTSHNRHSFRTACGYEFPCNWGTSAPPQLPTTPLGISPLNSAPTQQEGEEGEGAPPTDTALPCPAVNRSSWLLQGVETSLPLRFPPWLHSKGADTDHCFTVSNSTYSRAALELCGVSNYVLNPTAFANVAVTHFLPK